MPYSLSSVVRHVYRLSIMHNAAQLVHKPFVCFVVQRWHSLFWRQMSKVHGDMPGHHGGHPSKSYPLSKVLNFSQQAAMRSVTRADLMRSVQAIETSSSYLLWREAFHVIWNTLSIRTTFSILSTALVKQTFYTCRMFSRSCRPSNDINVPPFGGSILCNNSPMQYLSWSIYRRATIGTRACVQTDQSDDVGIDFVRFAIKRATRTVAPPSDRRQRLQSRRNGGNQFENWRLRTLVCETVSGTLTGGRTEHLLIRGTTKTTTARGSWKQMPEYIQWKINAQPSGVRLGGWSG